MVLVHVIFGLPLSIRPSVVHPSAIIQSFSPSLLNMCPSQFHFLHHTSQLMLLISAISLTLLFVILCCHLILSILRHWQWKLVNFLPSAFVIFHVLQPYRRSGSVLTRTRHCRTLLGNAALEFSPRGPKGAKKERKNALCNIRTFLLNINQNLIGYGVFIQTLNIYYLREYEVFTLTQSCE